MGILGEIVPRPAQLIEKININSIDLLIVAR